MKKILIIEDEKSLANILATKLAGRKSKTLIANNGQAGLELALKEKPDLILLDIVMPVMDGLTMLKKLRADKWGAKVPVIILTNLSEMDKTAEALDGGVHDFLIKIDWTLEDIVKKVNEKLS